MGFKLADLFVELSTRGGERVNESIDVIKGKLLGIPSTFQAFEVAMDKIHDFVSESAAVFNEQQSAAVKMAALLQTTGHAAGYTSSQLKEMADELSKVTSFSPTNVMQGMSQLLRFPDVQGAMYARAIKLSTDLAAAGMGDVASSAAAVGRALENPASGMMALTRAGVVLNANERERVKALTDSGRLLEAQALLLDKIESTVGDLAKKMVTPADRLRAKMEEIQVAIGGGIVPVMNAFMERLTSATPDAEKLGVAFKGVGNEIAAMVTGLGSASKAANELSLDLLAMRSMQAQDWLSKTLTGSNQGKGIFGTATGFLGNAGSATGSLLGAMFGPVDEWDRAMEKTARSRTAGGKGEDPRSMWDKFWDRFQTRLVGDEKAGFAGGIKRDPANPDNLPPELLALKQRNERRLAALNAPAAPEVLPNRPAPQRPKTFADAWHMTFGGGPTAAPQPLGRNLPTFGAPPQSTAPSADVFVTLFGSFDKGLAGSKLGQFIRDLPNLAKLADPFEKMTVQEASRKTKVNQAFWDKANKRDPVVWVGGREAEQQNAEEARRVNQGKEKQSTFSFSSFDQFAKSIQMGLAKDDAAKETAKNTAVVPGKLDGLKNAVDANTAAVKDLKFGFA